MPKGAVATVVLVAVAVVIVRYVIANYPPVAQYF